MQNTDTTNNAPLPWYQKISIPTYVYIFIGIVLAQIATLYFMGRLPICACGYVSLWEGDVMSAANSQQIADWYTFSHIIHGFAFYAFFIWISRKFFGKKGGLPLGMIFIGAVLLETAWEIAENSPFIIDYYRNNTVSLGYIGDSILNSVFDVVWMSIGFFAARKFPVWLTISLVIIFEVLTGILIRDGLALNILMFIYPADFIKVWQMGA